MRTNNMICNLFPEAGSRHGNADKVRKDDAVQDTVSFMTRSLTVFFYSRDRAPGRHH